MKDIIDCPRCSGKGWLRHDEHCPDCDGTGEVEEDPFFIGADILYDQMKDDLLDGNRKDGG